MKEQEGISEINDVLDGFSILGRGLAYLGINQLSVIEFAMMVEGTTETRRSELMGSLRKFVENANPKHESMEFIPFSKVLQLKKRLLRNEIDPNI